MDWNHFKSLYFSFREAEFALDLSKARLPQSFLTDGEARASLALEKMAELENGAIANPDENRMVGHYWLRNPSIAPSRQIQADVQSTLKDIHDFAHAVRSGQVVGQKGYFHNLLCVGIGGSALGPQFVAQALGHPDRDPLDVFFLDNTDPDGFDKVLGRIEAELGQTLVVVTSKSGGTPETRNGMVEVQAAYKAAGLDFSKHAVAITGVGSKLDEVAVREGWLKRFPMWDWVGGRTSELGPVGLIPAALSGYDINAMLAGASQMDELTRSRNVRRNPAALLALAWYALTDGKGSKDMVVLPYKDRLELFSRYLQQLVMESLGKELDLQGNRVEQGLAVYGNKGSTDQHAYIQQLREGINNFFAVFIEVLSDRDGASPKVDGEFTSGDYLHGFFLGTRDALAEKGRASLTLTIRKVSAHSVGQLIALFERAVGLYATMVNINAYHQPGVEAGKKAAAVTLKVRGQIAAHLKANPSRSFTAQQVANELQIPGQAEMVFKILLHIAANPHYGIEKYDAADVFETLFKCRNS